MLVVGSGFGGSVAALRLAERDTASASSRPGGASAPRPSRVRAGTCLAASPATCCARSHGASFEPEPEARIAPVRYGRGSNVMALLGVPLADPLRRPLVFLRARSLRRWSERTVILLPVQERDHAPRGGGWAASPVRTRG